MTTSWDCVQEYNGGSTRRTSLRCYVDYEGPYIPTQQCCHVIPTKNTCYMIGRTTMAPLRVLISMLYGPENNYPKGGTMPGI